jgi:hypothetical protein
MATHEQVWVKVNAPVDSGVAEIVSILNSVEGLQTLQSCQGDPGGREGYVYFFFGNWQSVCRFIFERIGPAVKQRADEEAAITIEATMAEEEPMAKLSFKTEAINMVVSALKEVLR